MNIEERIVIGIKAREPIYRLVGKKKTVDLVKHFYVGKRDDSDLLRLEMWEECC